VRTDEEGREHLKVLDFGIVKILQPGTLLGRSGQSQLKIPIDLNLQTEEGVTEKTIDGITESARAELTEAEGSDDENQLTTVGSRLGTIAYMSPEQCCGEPVDARSDIYSLGILTYEMLAGRSPFMGSRRELIQEQLTAQPPPLQQFNVD